jgi:ATP-binding cassette subfamily B protein
MATVEAMPPARQQQSENEEELIRLQADFGPDGGFGHRELVVTREAVRVLEPGGALGFQMPIGEIQTARNEPLVGGGRLEITAKNGDVVPVVTYSQTVAARFSEAARGIEQLAKGETFQISLKEERTRCIKCDRLLPEKDGICPACVNRSKTMWRIGGFLHPYKRQALGLAALSLLTTVLSLAPPLIQRNLINRVLAPPPGQHAHPALLLPLMGAWLAILFAGVGVNILHGRIVAFLGASIAADLRARLYRAIEFLQLNYFDKKQVGAITSRVTQDTDRVWGFLTEGVPFFLINGLLLLGIAGFLLSVNWKLTLCILAPVPVVVAIGVFFWKSVSQLFVRVGQKWARFHIHLNESLTGIRVVKAFAQEDHENAKFAVRNAELRDAGIAGDTRWNTIFGVMSLFVGLGSLINWAVGGYMVYRGQMNLGDFWLFNAYLALIYGPLQWFAQVNNWFSRAMAGAERIFEVMDTEKENYGQAEAPHAIEGSVEFDNVRFGYDKSNPVLKGLTFTAKPGEMIGLVGKSGAGKSTTINLLCRFYEPDAGTLKIDGVDYTEMSLQAMRRQIGIVLQEPFLFNGTVADNIAYGKPGASLEEIMAAAKAANAHNFVLAKPDGYDTMVGERGAKLSGGERQRVSIARAILHDPRILILDEATSAVDVETEKQIQEAIGRLIKGRTTFAIAHRLSTLRNADRLIVLDGGKIAEMGTHAELMEKKGEFFKLVETQSQVTQILGAV